MVSIIICDALSDVIYGRILIKIVQRFPAFCVPQKRQRCSPHEIRQTRSSSSVIHHTATFHLHIYILHRTPRPHPSSFHGKSNREFTFHPLSASRTTQPPREPKIPRTLPRKEPPLYSSNCAYSSSQLFQKTRPRAARLWCWWPPFAIVVAGRSVFRRRRRRVLCFVS